MVVSGHGEPDIFNTDQGSQFTSFAFTNVLRDNGIRISMDGRAAGWAMCLSSASGAALSMNAYICMPLKRARKPAPVSADGSTSTTDSGLTAAFADYPLNAITNRG